MKRKRQRKTPVKVYWLSGFFSDERGVPSSKRFVGIISGLILCMALFVNINPSNTLINAIALIVFGSLGLSSLDKNTKPKDFAISPPKLSSGLFGWFKDVFIDEKGIPSSKRFIGVFGALSLDISMFLPNEPSPALINAVALIVFGCLGLTSVDKFTKKRVEMSEAIEVPPPQEDEEEYEEEFGEEYEEGDAEAYDDYEEGSAEAVEPDEEI